MTAVNPYSSGFPEVPSNPTASTVSSASDYIDKLLSLGKHEEGEDSFEKHEEGGLGAVLDKHPLVKALVFILAGIGAWKMGLGKIIQAFTGAVSKKPAGATATVGKVRIA